jgi:hypothetical protein
MILTVSILMLKHKWFFCLSITLSLSPGQESLLGLGSYFSRLSCIVIRTGPDIEPLKASVHGLIGPTG